MARAWDAAAAAVANAPGCAGDAAAGSPQCGHMQAWARGAAATARVRVRERTQAKAGAAKDAAATSKLGLPWVAAARGPVRGQTRATEGAA